MSQQKLGGADDAKAALQGLKDAKKLRNEMEKVRLLLELVRKREKVKLLMVGFPICLLDS